MFMNHPNRKVIQIPRQGRVTGMRVRLRLARDGVEVPPGDPLRQHLGRHRRVELRPGGVPRLPGHLRAWTAFSLPRVKCMNTTTLRGWCINM